MCKTKPFLEDINEEIGIFHGFSADIDTSFPVSSQIAFAEPASNLISGRFFTIKTY